MNKNLVDSLIRKFTERYQSAPTIYRSPGRVNLIGEHTDYNNGFVLPAAIDKAIYLGIAKRSDDRILLFSEEFQQDDEATVATVQPSPKHWPNYVLGVVDQMNKRGYKIEGFNMNLDGDVPIGSGLSSSAAVECATAFALNNLFALGIEKKELVDIAQKAEHHFARVLCGIMDQFASVFGKKDHVIKLDCESRGFEYVPLQLEGYKIVLLNTNVKHSLASTAYNQRRHECITGVEWIKAAGHDVNSLRDVTMLQLEEIVKPKDALVFKRCSYVVKENARLLSACQDLAVGNILAMGKKMFATHEGLSKDYEVSCPELDFLVDAVKENKAVAGARMMGGGFGGCTINLVKEEAIDYLISDVSSRYKTAMNKELTAYIALTDDGSSVVE